jgi:pSer/pThr/pTyr-binding forkhead associated (FHA) protein
VGRIFFVAFVGAIAGLVAWAIVEPFAPKSISALNTLSSPEWKRWEGLFAIAVGGFIGLGIAGANGWYQGSRVHLMRSAALGLLLGAVFGSIGLNVGGAIGTAIFGHAGDMRQSIQTTIMWRSTIFLVFGAMIGLGVGIAGLSLTRVAQGVIGGLLGGFVAGVSFDSVSAMTASFVMTARGAQDGGVQEIGIFGRATLAVLLGLGIGFLTGIVALVSKRAWVRLEVGRNEGKEWVLDFPQAYIGRSETAHIPLFGDPNIAPMHARIDRAGGRFMLIDGGTPIGIGVNGIRVPSAELNHGDVINIGSYNLRFLTRGGSAVPLPKDTPRGMKQQPIHQVQQMQQIPQPAPASMPTPIPMAVPAGIALVALDGPIAGQRFPIGPHETIVGREGHILVSYDSSASRRHASIVQAGNGAIVRDLGSTNGTLVNGVRVQEMTLRTGDTVKVGATTFRLE